MCPDGSERRRKNHANQTTVWPVGGGSGRMKWIEKLVVAAVDGERRNKVIGEMCLCVMYYGRQQRVEKEEERDQRLTTHMLSLLNGINYETM